MDIDDLKNLCQSIVDTIECADKLSAEVKFWREKFLEKSSLMPEDPTYGAHIWMHFLAIPAETFMKKSPTEHIAEIKSAYSKSKAT